MVIFLRPTFDYCWPTNNTGATGNSKHFLAEDKNGGETQIHLSPQVGTTLRSPLKFMKSKLVLLVSHELSLSGGPLLLMELAFLLRGVGAEVVWITNQKPVEPDEVIYNLESKMLDRGVQILSAKGQKAIDTALQADLVILNNAVAGKWLDAVLKENIPRVLPKVLWWIHEMRGHYFKMEYVKHLASVAGAMIDSHTTADYWMNRTLERLKMSMPETYVVHVGNSKEFMEVAEDRFAERVKVHENPDARLYLPTNSLILQGSVYSLQILLANRYESLQLVQKQKLEVPSLHAVIVGSDMNAHTKFETELHNFVKEKKIQDRVHFVNKTLTVAPYLASIDVLVQNSQRTAAGGTMEIVLNGTTGLLHPAGKEGVSPLANNIVKLATHVERRLTMGKRGYERVKERFMEHHMAHRIAFVLKEVLRKAKSHSS